jgi:hypothetical protein
VYAAAGSYVTLLTISDGTGGSATGSATVTVSQASRPHPVDNSQPLVLRGLSFKSTEGKSSGKGKPDTPAMGSMKLKGEVVLPENTDLALGNVTIGFVNPLDSSLDDGPSEGGFANNDSGGQFYAAIGSDGKVVKVQMRFAIKPVKKPGFAANTNAFTFDYSNAAMLDALQRAIVNLTYDENGVELTADEQSQKRVGQVMMVVRFETADGDVLEYKKLAVVDIKPGKSSTLKLTRR